MSKIHPRQKPWRGVVGGLLAAFVLMAAACEAQRPERGDPGALVTFVRSGGLAGVDERLVVQPDGQATVTTRRQAEPSRFVLGPDKLDQLRSALDQARLPSLRRTYPVQGGTCSSTT